MLTLGSVVGNTLFLWLFALRVDSKNRCILFELFFGRNYFFVDLGGQPAFDLSFGLGRLHGMAL